MRRVTTLGRWTPPADSASFTRPGAALKTAAPFHYYARPTMPVKTDRDAPSQ